MIKSFKNSVTEDVFNGIVRKGFQADLIKVARRKLRFLHAAHLLTDLRVPPGNRLESLKGKRTGQHSIRVNDQFRICFVWTAEGPENVELTDYH
jgi:proteic killer suppression protein